MVKFPASARPRRRGLSLFELLVSLSVIALLATLLLPALGQAQAKARGLVCRNNLRQWGVGLHLYAEGHDDWLPPEGTPSPTERSTNVGWYIQLPQELNLPRYHDQPWHTNASIAPSRSLWICPANPRRSNGRNLFHYCLNQHVDGTGDDDDRPIRLTSIQRPSLLVYLFDNGGRAACAQQNNAHSNLHSQGAHFLLIDGHTVRLPASAYWDARRNRGLTNPAAITWID